jgi:hypothetical protein
MIPILKTLILAMSLEGGIIPTADVALFSLPTEQTIIQTNPSFYTDMACRLEIWKYFYIGGGMTSYQWGIKNNLSNSPFRMDFDFEIGEKWKCLELGYKHRCIHPVAANINLPDNTINSSYNYVFMRVEIRKNLFGE